MSSHSPNNISSLDFEACAYPHAPAELQVALRHQRDLISTFLASNYGRSHLTPKPEQTKLSLAAKR
jgi:hypothetical protein